MIDDAKLLMAWERGYGKPPFLRAIALLALSLPEASIETLMSLAIGKRDAFLLRLRQLLFGNTLETLAGCPECHESLELNISSDDLLVGIETSVSEIHTLEFEGQTIQFRPPNSRDLEQLMAVPASQRRNSLINRCLIDPPALELSDRAIQTLAAAISDADPQGDIRFDLTCAACQHSFAQSFDIVSFLWAEVNAWAERLLTDIHSLAKSYGWSQSEILRLSPWRRQVYLNMVRQ